MASEETTKDDAAPVKTDDEPTADVEPKTVKKVWAGSGNLAHVPGLGAMLEPGDVMEIPVSFYEASPDLWQDAPTTKSKES